MWLIKTDGIADVEHVCVQSYQLAPLGLECGGPNIIPDQPSLVRECSEALELAVLPETSPALEGTSEILE